MKKQAIMKMRFLMKITQAVI